MNWFSQERLGSVLLSGDKEKGKGDEWENNHRALGGSGMTFHSKQSMYHQVQCLWCTNKITLQWKSFCSFKHWLTLSFKWLDATYVIATTSLQVTGLGGVAGCFLLSSCCWSFFLDQNTCVAVCFTLLIFFFFVGSSAAGRPRLVTKSQEAVFIIFGWFNYLKE